MAALKSFRMISIPQFTPASRRAMAVKFFRFGMIPKADSISVRNRMSRRASWVAVVAFAAIPLFGCGKRANTVSVAGTITYGKKAVTDGLINFLPPKGRPLGGGIN